MNETKILGCIFILFGSVTFGDFLINDPESSYTVRDLLHGWGIYSITIGSILLARQYIKTNLIICFVVSIIWHLSIVKKRKWTSHHVHSIIANLVAIGLALCISQE